MVLEVVLFVDLHGSIRIPLGDLPVSDHLMSFTLVASVREQTDGVAPDVLGG